MKGFEYAGTVRNGYINRDVSRYTLEYVDTLGNVQTLFSVVCPECGENCGWHTSPSMAFELGTNHYTKRHHVDMCEYDTIEALTMLYRKYGPDVSDTVDGICARFDANPHLWNGTAEMQEEARQLTQDLRALGNRTVDAYPVEISSEEGRPYPEH